MHECTHEPTCDWANLASEPSERSEATKAAVESGRSSGRAERRAKNTGRWQRCLPVGAELTPEPSHRSCAKGAEMSQLKTDEQDGAAEATRPMGWVREGKRCAHPKRHRPGGGAPPAGAPGLLFGTKRCTLFHTNKGTRGLTTPLGGFKSTTKPSTLKKSSQNNQF